MRVQWFYRPEETASGRQAFHGKDELFESDHFDWLPIGCLKRKIKVHDVQGYVTLKSQVRARDFLLGTEAAESV